MLCLVTVRKCQHSQEIGTVKLSGLLNIDDKLKAPFFVLLNAIVLKDKCSDSLCVRRNFSLLVYLSILAK